MSHKFSPLFFSKETFTTDYPMNQFVPAPVASNEAWDTISSQISGHPAAPSLQHFVAVTHLPSYQEHKLVTIVAGIEGVTKLAKYEPLFHLLCTGAVDRVLSIKQA